MTTAILAHSLFILSLLGLWRPIDFRGWKSLLYNLYSYFIAFANLAFIVTEFTDIVLFNNTISDFTNGLSRMIGVITAFRKIIGIMSNRNMILHILKLLDLKPYKLNDQYENDIRKKYVSFSNFITLIYFAAFTMGALGAVVTQILIMEFPDVLPYRAWFPYKYSERIIFLTTAYYQIFTFIHGAYIHAAFDTLYIEAMLCVSIQINVLEYRLEKIIASMHKFENIAVTPSGMYNACNLLIAEWVNHHNKVLRLSKNVHKTFSGPIFLQYCMSSSLICVTVYSMSNFPIYSPGFISELPFLIGATFQMFMLCITAHQVALKFEDLNYSVYSTDWFNLDTKVQKSIIIIILLTSKPVVFTAGYFVTLSLESFKQMMKLSYSIYNLIQ